MGKSAHSAAAPAIEACASTTTSASLAAPRRQSAIAAR